jgi:ABC-2 type transport system ATP-binding protein
MPIKIAKGRGYVLGCELEIAKLKSVTMTYGRLVALDDVSFSLKQGEAIAVLGPNGAGKTTSIRLLTGLKRTQQGSASLFGMDPQLPEARQSIGVTPQEASFPHAQKVGEILDFARVHYANPISRAELVEAFDLGAIENRIAIELSGGQQRRLAVALAFCGNPKVVFLDEPTTGIDAKSRQKMWDYIVQFKRNGGSIFLTTHYLEEAEHIADRIVLLDKGKVVASGTVKEIKNVIDVRIVRFSAEDEPVLPSARFQKKQDDLYQFLSPNADETVRELVNSKLRFSNLEVLPAKLDDAVAELLKDKS